MLTILRHQHFCRWLILGKVSYMLYGKILGWQNVLSSFSQPVAWFINLNGTSSPSPLTFLPVPHLLKGSWLYLCTNRWKQDISAGLSLSLWTSGELLSVLSTMLIQQVQSKAGKIAVCCNEPPTWESERGVLSHAPLLKCIIQLNFLMGSVILRGKVNLSLPDRIITIPPPHLMECQLHNGGQPGSFLGIPNCNIC